MVAYCSPQFPGGSCIRNIPNDPLTPHDIPWSVTDTWNNTETLGQSIGPSQWYVVRNVPGLYAPWSIIIKPLVPSRTSRTSQSEILTVSRNLSTNMLLLTVGSIGYPEVKLLHSSQRPCYSSGWSNVTCYGHRSKSGWSHDWLG